MIHESRIKFLNREKVKPGKYVLYWMQQSQRSEYNHALEYTIDRANALDLPVVVLFVIASHYPEANARHYTFMLDGIRALRTELIDRGISFIIRQGKPPEEAFENMLYLNNKYFLDGRDPNSFAGVAWCFGKHDRAWAERRIFGKVRYMNSKGLERKFDIDKYVANVAEM